MSASGGMRFDFGFGRGHGDSDARTERPFRILILGPFAGAKDDRTVPATLRVRRFDCDTLDERLAELRPEARLDPAHDGDPQMTLGFGSLEDFHPDGVFDRLPVFAKLRELRKRLLNPASFDEAVREFRELAQYRATPAPHPPPQPTAPAAAPADASADAGDNDFDRLMGQAASPPRNPPPVTAGNAAIESLIRNLVAPHVVDAPDPRRDDMVAAVDDAIGKEMRRILHAADFRTIEAAWRTADFLARNLETDEGLELYLAELPRAALEAALAAPDGGELNRILVREPRETPGGTPWTLVVGLYAFAPDDAPLLTALGSLMARAGTVFLAAHVFDDARPAAEQLGAGDAWDTLRGGPGGAHIALSLPGVMLRLPYGEHTDATERFDFEEAGSPPSTDDYLWGHAGAVCACVLGQAFNNDGWDMRTGGIAELSGLPIHVYRHDGESRMTPCAQVWLRDSDADALLAAGITPVMSILGRDAVRIPQLITLDGNPVRPG